MSDFSIENIWNKAIQYSNESYPAKPRNYIRASEIGKPFLDVYLTMKGVKPTNPFDERTLRKFEAGRLFEWLIGNVFRKTGLTVKDNESITPLHIEGLLPVYGHYDFLVSGCGNWEEASVRVLAEKYPKGIELICLKLIEWLREKYPIVYGANNRTIRGIEPILYEVKSVNSQVFWAKKEYLLDAYPFHKLQGYAYAKALGLDSFRILYISKDDLTLAEFEIKLTKELEAKWYDWISKISKYIMNDVSPNPEPDIVYNDEKKRWDLNWEMQRSVYLSHITGLSSDEWGKKWSEVCKTKNRVLGTEKAKETKRIKKEALASKGN